MASTQLNLREDLFAMIQQMDSNLLQRLKDYATGLVDATKEEDDNEWLDKLSEEDRKNVLEGMADIEAGRYSTKDEFFKELREYRK